MLSHTTFWTTPPFDSHYNQMDEDKKSLVERNIIEPAIAAIENNIISIYLAFMSLGTGFNLQEDAIEKGPIPDSWDSSVRFKDHGKCEAGILLGRVLPYLSEKTEGSISSASNPVFNEPGLIVFARSKPFNGHIVTLKRRNSDRAEIEITVKIPDESAFQTKWLRT